MRLGSDWICKLCEFVNGMWMVIWYLGDQAIVRNAVWTNWWWGELEIKCVDDFRLRLFTDCLTGRLFYWLNLLLKAWATDWLIYWVVGRLADRSMYRGSQNVLLLLYSHLYHFHLISKSGLLFWAYVFSGTNPTKLPKGVFIHETLLEPQDSSQVNCLRKLAANLHKLGGAF